MRKAECERALAADRRENSDSRRRPGRPAGGGNPIPHDRRSLPCCLAGPRQDLPKWCNRLQRRSNLAFADSRADYGGLPEADLRPPRLPHRSEAVTAACLRKFLSLAPEREL